VQGWGWFFWLVQLRRGDWWDLRNDVEGWHAGALMLRFVVACGGDGVEREGVDDTGSEGGVAVAAAAGVALGVGVVGVEGAGGVGNAAGDSVGVEGASGVDEPGGVV